jgi:hypothetical protein
MRLKASTPPPFVLDSCSTAAQLPQYNSFRDEHLTAFFGVKTRRKLLRR